MRPLLVSVVQASVIKTGLAVSLSAFVGCRSWQTTRVLSYSQGEALSVDYVRHYNPHRNQAKWVGPPAAFTHYRRAHPTDAAIITGCVFRQEPVGEPIPLPGAIIKIDKAHIFADPAGNYVFVLAPGRHRIWGGGVGLLYSEALPLRVGSGDSIRINFHLLPDFRPLID